MSKEKSTEEIRNDFLDYVGGLVRYWEKNGKDTKDALEGLAFSIMNILDGNTNLPSFIVAPVPHPDDKQYHIDNDQDYYPENHDVDIKGDISSCLHELIDRHMK